MKPYTATAPEFARSIIVPEPTDTNHADNINAAPKQLLQNTLKNRDDLDGLGTKVENMSSDKADIESPEFTGEPKAPTPPQSSNGARVATTGFVAGAVSGHDASPSAHDDMRHLISGLTARLNALADSDDTTLDQLSEIVAYIKNNKSLIDGVTTGKVNVSDIIDNLTSAATNKPLSAKQGKTLKDLVDALTTTIGNKVDKIAGKGLSANDFTDAEKSRLDGACNQANGAAEKLNGAAVAIGGNAAASGSNSIAVGLSASVKGYESIAIGHNANAYNSDSVAIGYGACTDFHSSVAIGSGARTDKYYSVALGPYARAQNNWCIAIGQSSNTGYEGSVAIGNAAKSAGYNSVALGTNSKANGGESVAIGYNACTNNSSSVAIGYNACTNNSSSVAIGYNTYVGGKSSAALGNYARVPIAKSNTIQLGNSSSLSELSCRVALTVTSDERDKADITEIGGGAVEFLKKIRGIRYVFNHRELYIDEAGLSEGQKRQRETYGLCEYDREAHARGDKKGSRMRVGVSAQETLRALEEVYGDPGYANLVNDNFFDLDPDGIPEGVENQLSANYEGFIPFLIKAVQELSERLEALEGPAEGGGTAWGNS